MFKRILAISLFSFILLSSLANAKPNLWVFSDLSDPRDLRDHGHPQNDPDDISALAALLLTADRFNIEAFVFASNTRKNLADATPFIMDSFNEAYMRSVPMWKSQGKDYQEKINFIRSDISKTGTPIRFNINNDYKEIPQVNSIQPLAELLKHKPLYVLNWGPLTESAILVKHLVTTKNTQALKNLVIISHWTKGATAQGTVEKPFDVANCKDDYSACEYLHDEALKNPLVQFIEIGPAGQSGIVNGSIKFKRYSEFDGTPLGQLFYHSKFYGGKPDQSDAATFWVLTEFGANLSDYPTNGSLSVDNEKIVVQKFYDDGKEIIEDLSKKSASTIGAKVFSQQQISEWFTYIFLKNQMLEVHLPYDGELLVKTQTGKEIYNKKLARGEHKLEYKQYLSGPLIAKLHVAGVVKTLKIHKE